MEIQTILCSIMISAWYRKNKYSQTCLEPRSTANYKCGLCWQVAFLSEHQKLPIRFFMGQIKTWLWLSGQETATHRCIWLSSVLVWLYLTYICPGVTVFDLHLSWCDCIWLTSVLVWLHLTYICPGVTAFELHLSWCDCIWLTSVLVWLYLTYICPGVTVFDLHLDVLVMKGCNSFFKLYHLQPFITGTSICPAEYDELTV